MFVKFITYLLDCMVIFFRSYCSFSCYPQKNRHSWKREKGGIIGIERGGQWGHSPKKILENIIILCFERRFSKQNSVIRLKPNILPTQNFLPPQKIFWAGYVTGNYQNILLLSHLSMSQTTNYFFILYGVSTHLCDQKTLSFVRLSHCLGGLRCRLKQCFVLRLIQASMGLMLIIPLQQHINADSN